MDLVRVGAALRAIRFARGERIADVAVRTGLSASTVGRIERGLARDAPLSSFERVAAALGAGVDLWVRWRGAELDRLIYAGHSALREVLARLFAALPTWQAFPEVSFSFYGERGVIDWLAWHPATRSLLIVEIKTAIVDVQALLGQVDRYVRPARRIADERGEPATISLWLVVADVSRNRRAVAGHRLLFNHVFYGERSRDAFVATKTQRAYPGVVLSVEWSRGGRSTEADAFSRGGIPTSTHESGRWSSVASRSTCLTVTE